MSNEKHAELLTAVTVAARRHYVAYTLFNQALANRLGLHPTDLQCLGLLELEAEPLSTGEIAKLIGLTSGSATRLVDRLEKAGFIIRTPDPLDRRKALVSLATRRGAEADEAWEEPGNAFADVLADFSTDELTVIERYLRRTTEVGTEQAARLTGQ